MLVAQMTPLYLALTVALCVGVVIAYPSGQFYPPSMIQYSPDDLPAPPLREYYPEDEQEQGYGRPEAIYGHAERKRHALSVNQEMMAIASMLQSHEKQRSYDKARSFLSQLGKRGHWERMDKYD